MEEKTFWQIEKENGRRILRWDCLKNSENHSDFIEMSGLYSSLILKYAIENGKPLFKRHLVFPMLRIFPNDTHGSYKLAVDDSVITRILVNGKPVEEKAVNFKLNGTVECNSFYKDEDTEIEFKRNFFPSVDKQAVCEMITILNIGVHKVTVSLEGKTCKKLDGIVGPMGSISTMLHAKIAGQNGRNQVILSSKEKVIVSITYTGRISMETDPVLNIDIEEEYSKRIKRVDELTSKLILDTGNELIDTMYSFAKVRAGESIFRTMKGDVHSPGGGAYYAAVWCNDQAEYTGPWQSYTGDELQLNAGYNAYSWYYPFMDDTYEPIPSSIIAEGTSFWNGAKDRGDAAMYLYGASRFALTCGYMGANNELWKAIKWCAEYCISRKNGEGVIKSDTDELENRLPSGDANLCTSMLAFGGFKYASRIAAALGEKEIAIKFLKEAEDLEIASDKYFSANIRGFDTYKYYKENTTLRSWICMPLCVDVFSRVEGTTAAIMSRYLMSDAGQLAEEGTCVVWDRSTLYGLRGIFRAGKSNEAWDHLQGYCKKRLIGKHVPYAVEAYPEGEMRHLSAESALFCQIITDGILAVDSLSFNSFSFSPTLAENMDHLSLSNICAFGEIFDIVINQSGWTIKTQSGKTFSGALTNRQTIIF